jgi:hypothetical protein
MKSRDLSALHTLKAAGGSPSGKDVGTRDRTQGLLPSVSEELAMAVQLAPEKEDHAAAEGEATMAESQPAVVSGAREVSDAGPVEEEGDDGTEGTVQRAKRLKKERGDEN